MKIITKTYDKQSKTLVVTYLNPYHLVGFDCKGFKVYQTVEAKRTFIGMNKQDCMYRMRKYFDVPECYVYHRRYADLSRQVL